MQGGTVKQFIDILDEMRTIYPFEDDKTRLSTHNIETISHNAVTIVTQDKETGIWIELSKAIKQEPFGRCEHG